MKIIFVTLCCLTLTNCASKAPRPKMLSFTPASVIIDYTANNDLQDATDAAQKFCATIGKDAQYVRHTEEGWLSKTRIAYFNCVKSTVNRVPHGNAYLQKDSAPIINNYNR